MQKNTPLSQVMLTGKNTSLVLALQQNQPVILYWGKRLSNVTDTQMLALLRLRQETPSAPTDEVALTLCPTHGQGFTGHPGIKLHGSGDEWAFKASHSELQKITDYHVIITSIDQHRAIQLTHDLKLDSDSDVLRLSSRISNLGDTSINLDWCAAATLPMPSYIKQIKGFEGHWAIEFQEQASQQLVGSYVRENRRGRTSHDTFPGLVMHANHTDQLQGECYGFHLGWSGNNRIVSEKMADGRAFVQMGEYLFPGEIALNKDESYQTPDLFISFSTDGFSGLSRQFHRFVRSHILSEAVRTKPRPVHYNTWEGIYFDHNMPTLLDLVELAAEMGVERFVLDDGWFPGRHNDKAGLGDWFVDLEKYPEGLTPLVAAVNAKGMEFGLWLEPEMVNPDSDLYRQHPDWVLSTPPNEQLSFRSQLVLDLSRSQVFDYLYERIDSLLSEHNIAYVKWDMNRDLNHPGDANSKPAIHKQTRALYALLDKIKAAHPYVEIESCASGGGRADYGILSRTDRVWTSDSNDALDRLKIQQGFSYFFPAELMGSHVGPRDCHITHRHLNMNTRAPVALFGHMGMEMDLRELTEKEKTKLKAMVSLYKQHRSWLHKGDIYRLDLADYAHGFGMVSNPEESGMHQALFSYTVLKTHATSMPDSIRFVGLKEAALYKLDVLWPLNDSQHWPQESVFNFDTCLPQINGQVLSGAALMQLGLQVPRLVPAANLIFHLQQVEKA